MEPFTRNDIIGLAELFRLAAKNPQPTPGQVFVLLSPEDCMRLADLLAASAPHGPRSGSLAKPVIIRYAHPEVGDQFVQPPKDGFPGGYWTSGQRGGERGAMRFPDEAQAKAFMVRHGYDLAPLKTTFQPVPD